MRYLNRYIFPCKHCGAEIRSSRNCLDISCFNCKRMLNKMRTQDVCECGNVKLKKSKRCMKHRLRTAVGL